MANLLSKLWYNEKAGLDQEKSYIAPAYYNNPASEPLVERYRIARRTEVSPDAWKKLGESFLESGLYEEVKPPSSRWFPRLTIP